MLARMPPDGDGRFLLPVMLLSTALSSGCKAPPPAGAATVQVAAAADLSLAFEELGKLFELRTGQKASFSFGSSGLLSKQIAQGAPFDLFASASASFVDSTVQAGACDAKTKAPYARGYLVIWSKSSSGVLAAKSLADLAEPRFKRIAIANPEHAPYGKAAREALIQVGVWGTVEPRLVYGENIRQTLQLAQSGNVEAAIVALSLVPNGGGGELTKVDSKLHRPIEQTLVVCQKGKNEAGARAFASLVALKEGQDLLKRYGFGTTTQ